MFLISKISWIEKLKAIFLLVWNHNKGLMFYLRIFLIRTTSFKILRHYQKAILTVVLIKGGDFNYRSLISMWTMCQIELANISTPLAGAGGLFVEVKFS